MAQLVLPGLFSLAGLAIDDEQIKRKEVQKND